MSDAIRVLERSLQIFQNNGTWTQNVFARDSNSNWIWPTNEDAVSFCPIGVLIRSAHDLFPDDVLRGDAAAQFVAKHLVEEVQPPGYISFLKYDVDHEVVEKWNDEPDRTKEDVVVVFKKVLGDLQ